MIPSNTICVSQEGPANALALNKDCTQVVIAGRNVFKVFSISDNEFSEVCNLRVGKNLNLNFSSIDVAWSTIEENTLATAATNGAVVVWNLGRSGRSKQEHVFSDHKRTVNKVSFHLTEPALLISGSQDGMMKCFDLRMKEVARTFMSNTESIRDVQFSPHQANTFAAVSENGNVQLWDIRRHERCLQQFTAHSGPVFACDWHPEMPWLATASRDKTIKVWDIHTKYNLEHTIYTIASVGHVKWRPQKKFQVASCALVLDCAVHVWDVRRPHVPLATFAEHRDVTTAIAWLAEPHAFLSTSRDCSLYRHRFIEAAHPVLWANPHGVCVSARGELAHAAPERPLPALTPRRPPDRPPPALGYRAPPLWANPHGVCVSARGELAHAAPERPLPALTPRRPPDRPPPALGRKQPTAGSLSAGAQAQLERAFPGGSMSTLVRHRSRAPGPDRRTWALVGCARQYRMRGAPPHELADHNAAVAAAYDRHMSTEDAVTLLTDKITKELDSGNKCIGLFLDLAKAFDTVSKPILLKKMELVEVRGLALNWFTSYLTDREQALPVAHVWRVVRAWSAARQRPPARRRPPPPAAAPPPPLQVYSSKLPEGYEYGRSAVEEEPPEEAEEWAETQFQNSGVLGLPTLTIYIPPAKHAKLRHTDENAGWVSAASAHYVDVDAIDWTLPEEAFPLRSAPPAPAPAAPPAPARPPAPPAADHLGSGSGGSSPGSGSGLGSGSGSGSPRDHNLASHSAVNSEEGEAALSVRSGGGEAARCAPELAPLLAAALAAHARLGDVQTAAVGLLLLQDHRSDLFPYIDESLQEQWLLGYIEILQRHKLWNVATEVIRNAWLSSVWSLSQQSTSVAMCCARCGRRTRAHAACERCPPARPDLCAVCHQVVRGLYAWCQGCSHGGHLHHMRRWMMTHQLCPAGCGHHCQLG